MKSLHNKLYIITTLILITYSTSSAQSNLLVGTWVLDANKSELLITGTMKGKYDSLSLGKQNEIKAVMNGRKFVFRDDRTFGVTWKAGTQMRQSSGIWSLSNDEGMVTITLDGAIYEFDYSFQNGELHLSNRQVTGFFTTLCFTRQ